MLKRAPSLPTFNVNISDFVTSDSGFLTPTASSLPDTHSAWEQFLSSLSDPDFRAQVGSTFPELGDETSELDDQQRARALKVLTMITSAYVAGNGTDDGVVHQLPECLSIPLCSLAGDIGTPPSLSYTSMVTYNWKMLDSSGGIERGNVVVSDTFTKHKSEEQVLQALLRADQHSIKLLAATTEIMRYASRDDDATLTPEIRAGKVTAGLERVSAVIKEMGGEMEQLLQDVDTTEFQKKVLYYYGPWPADGDGLIFCGMSDEAEVYKGFSLLQGPVPHCLALLVPSSAVPFEQVHMFQYRPYLALEHRELLEALEAGPPLAAAIEAQADSFPDQMAAYQSVTTAVKEFFSVVITASDKLGFDLPPAPRPEEQQIQRVNTGLKRQLSLARSMSRKSLGGTK